MPSPIGHGLGAITCGWLASGRAPEWRTLLRRSLLLAVVGMAPDLDLLIGRHSAETHSLGAAVLAASVAAWLRVPVAATRGRIWWAVALAWASHPLLDALGRDGSPPLGVMMFWPLSSDHVTSGWNVFDPISRRWWIDGFYRHNGVAALKELAILGPIVWVCWWFRMRRR